MNLHLFVVKYDDSVLRTFLIFLMQYITEMEVSALVGT